MANRKGNGSVLQAILMLPTSTAQSITPCAVVNTGLTQIDAIVLQCMDNNSLSFTDKLMIDLLYTNGCRVSEILQIHSKNIRVDGSIFIHGLKGSNDRIIHSTYFSVQLMQMRLNNCFVFMDISRFYYHRLFVKLGLYSSFSTSEKRAVTHVLRHNYIAKIQAEFKDLNLTNRSTGQKSISSTLHYTKKNKVN